MVDALIDIVKEEKRPDMEPQYEASGALGKLSFIEKVKQQLLADPTGK